MAAKKSRVVEAPEVRFKRVTVKKVNGILKSLATIARLKASTKADRDAIETAVSDALASTISQLEGQKAPQGFKL